MIKSNRGQLSIFMGITLILVMGMLAFIINVGLFVKAKINLQNAVDAAAFSGAATQSRQLTNIAYVNWEMRNTFKEWMFKYYVLGHMGLVKGNNSLSESGLSANGDTVSFLLRTPPKETIGTVGFDKYNIPSICVHNNSSVDICPLQTLPGLPRFPAIGVAGISEIHEAFVNKLVEQKGANCSERTQINFLAAMSWAYSSGIKAIPGAPLIATNRAGAWPEALELAMRMRNLEMIVNRPPVEEMTFNNVNTYAQSGSDIGFNERPVKAFMSAFRNLGGGKYKGRLGEGGTPSMESVDELAATFKLTEISPQPYHVEANSASGFLIPNSFNYPGGFTGYDKHYLDLQAVPVNYATMFTTFATTRNEFEPSVAAEATCAVSKSAMPVPGYILGFVKNPAVLTYYAVKGEAEFTGLFFPGKPDGQKRSFKLTAYAAAKPFGGRIGPKLFGFLDGDRSVVPRTDENSRSMPYISGIDVGISSGGFAPGMPIPSSQTFWANDLTSVVGGVPGTNPNISFGIPNMIYDFRTEDDLGVQEGGSGNGKIQIIKAKAAAGFKSTEIKGLYHSAQYRALKSSLGPKDFSGRNMTSEDLMKALVMARRVTKYDAANYLIPVASRGNNGVTPNAAPTVKAVGSTGVDVGIIYKLFAPLVGPELLYKSNNEVGDIVLNYMKSNDKAVDVYLESLLQVANSILTLPSGQGSPTNVNAQAAQSIHINAGGTNAATPNLLQGESSTAPTCKKDMASKFNHFFRGRSVECGIVPLEMLMVEYIDKKNQQEGKYYYMNSYYNPLPANQSMTAYFPGPRQGATPDDNAIAINPIGVNPNGNSASYSTRRNYYSTKFVPLSKLFASSASYKSEVFMESDVKSPIDMQDIIQLNPIKADGSTGLDKPYFLDF